MKSIQTGFSGFGNKVIDIFPRYWLPWKLFLVTGQNLNLKNGVTGAREGNTAKSREVGGRIMGVKGNEVIVSEDFLEKYFPNARNETISHVERLQNGNIHF